MLASAHAHGLRLVMDLVVNHCSDEHEWFQKALKDPEGEYGQYFYFAKKKDGKLPCNWRSYFGGSVWENVEGTDWYYLHMFHKKQPDLNWENPKLREEIYKMMNWWLDQGIAGFRMDVIDLIGKIPDQKIKENGPMLHSYLQEMNEATFGSRDSMTVGEC